MKIKFSNIGPIQTASISTGNLMVFVGANGTGKSYAAKIIYGLYSEKIRSNFIRTNIRNLCSELLGRYPNSLNELSSNLLELKVPEVRKFQAQAIQQFSTFFSKQLPAFFSDDGGLFSGSSVDIAQSTKISRETLDVWTAVVRQRVVAALSKIETQDESIQQIGAETYERAMILNLSSLFIEAIITDTMQGTVVSNSYYLPASRSNILLTSKLIYQARGSKRNQLTNALKYPSNVDQLGLLDVFESRFDLNTEPEFFDTPTEDFINSIYTVTSRSSRVSSSQDSVRKLADKLENDLYRGDKLEISLLGRLPEFRLKLKNKKLIRLHLSSSMVMETSPLSIYLRYSATKSDLLIIDEPESHLHPIAQIKIIKHLVALSNQGVKVIIVTHSPYILSCINNHIKAGKIIEFCAKEDCPNEIKEKIGRIAAPDVLGEPLKPDTCRAYLFEENGKIKSIIDSESGMIDEESFTEPFNSINEIYQSIRDIEWDYRESHENADSDR